MVVLVGIALVLGFGVGLLVGASWASRPESGGSSENGGSPAPSISRTVPSGGSPAADSPAPEADSGSDVSQLLESLESLPSPSDAVPPYDRALFGQAWFDSDRNGCDTRNDILRRDLMDVEIKSDTNGCKVLSGRLIDPYSGDAMTFVSGVDTSVLVQIDHVVPLAWAWDNGASAWTNDERQDFANDPLNLLAVSGELNQEKSAQGPASWLPPNRAAHCGYAEQFTEVLIAYRLAVPVQDRAALNRLLENCEF